MTSRSVNCFMLMVVWSAATSYSASLYSQEIPFPPPTPPRGAEQRPVDQPEETPESPREVIDSVGKRLRAVEAGERDFRRQTPEWFAIEEALADVLKTVDSDEQLALGSEVRFAKAVLAALIPDNEADKLALAARNDLIELLQECKEAERVPSGNKHKWLEVSARLKRVSAAARTAESIKAQDGIVVEIMLFEVERRMLEAKTAFAASAFALFPIDRGNEKVYRAMERALQFIKLKQIQQIRTAALERWLIFHAMWQAGIIGVEEEAGPRETVYHYEAIWHEAKAR